MPKNSKDSCCPICSDGRAWNGKNDDIVGFLYRNWALTALSSAQPARTVTQPAASASAPQAAPTVAVAPMAVPVPEGNARDAAPAPSASVSQGPATTAPASPAMASPSTGLPATANNGTQAAESPLHAQPIFQARPEPLGGTLTPGAVAQAPAPEVSEPPRTYEHRFTATLDLANVLWRPSRGYDLFSSNNAAWRIGLGLGYDLYKLPSQVILAVEVGALLEPGQSTNSDSGLLGNTLHGSISAATFLLGGSLRWAMTPWLAPYGRLQLFTSRYAVDIQTSAGDATTTASGGEWSYHRWAEGGALGAGVMANLPPRSPVNVGILLEGGYWLQQSVDLVLEGNPSPGSITTAGARIGSVGNSGPYLRVAGMLRF